MAEGAYSERQRVATESSTLEAREAAADRADALERLRPLSS